MALKHVEVAIGVLVQNRQGLDHYLITLRRQDAVLGGFWEFPGGKIEPGESPQACVVREFREEVGLEVSVEKSLGELEHVYEHAHVTIRPFRCRWLAGEPRNLQVADHRWVRPRDLSRYAFPPANAPLLELLTSEQA
ncbi:MAG: 8-oxo-dGTP diphosphatase MutT [Phycisphaeraceae bacterium]|nr:8-oxo-dGTP diphosphatase MutT [Phycisphaeraceae bacterium]